MELREIEKLIEKYEAAETSLSEEKALREYFKTREVPPRLQVYRAIFGYAHQQKQQHFSDIPELKSERRKVNYWWSGVAATVILALGLFLYQDNDMRKSQEDLGTITDEEMAYQKTKETLRLVSEYMNEGTEDLVYLKEFGKTTNKIIKEK
ncbi:hypothetical protein [Salegentibacter chungangensis]|uniref:Anti-sigma factor n=1 Tax=Salegentibacter chungangensis TaxID=1335724 RepID=A0ABW3NU43_9FLAO